MNLEIFSRLESEVRSYVRSFPVIFRSAKGSCMTDDSGREYIDFFSGAGTLNYGHNNPILKESLLEYIRADGITHSLDMATAAKRQFMEVFEQNVLRPRGLNYKLQFTGPTGTNAVEAALKIARQVTQRANVVAFTHSFHGVSAGSLAATANRKFRQAAGSVLPNVTFVPYDGYLGHGVKTVGYLEKLLLDPSSGMDRPGAVIVETVQGEGGVNVASTDWLSELEQLCRRHEILLIVDDIQVGCGRTGAFFSFETAGIVPDVITLSKSISGYGLPMSLVLVKPELDIWKPGAHSGTFRGNNLAFVTGAAAIEHYWSSDVFAGEVNRKGETVRACLMDIVGEFGADQLSTRGRGMIQGLVTATAEMAGKIARCAFDKGLVIETAGAHDEVLKVLAPLTIEPDLLARGLSIIRESVGEVMKK